MEENITLAENVVDTPSTPEEASQVNNDAVETEPQTNQATGRSYTKSEVQDLMRKRVERSHRAFFTRYGVENLKGLDNLLYGNEELRGKNLELTREVAFLKNNINPDKYEDIIAHFKGNDLEFNEETLIELLKTHPEWVKAQPQPTQPVVNKIGVEGTKKPVVDERALASKLLGVKL